MKLHNFIFCVGAIIGARLLPAHGIPVEISEKDVKGDLLRGISPDVTERSMINWKQESLFAMTSMVAARLMWKVLGAKNLLP